MTAAAPRQVSPHDRRLAAQLAQRARQALGQKQLDYAIELLMECCALDPGNVVARKTLRQTQRAKFGSPSQVGAASWLVNLFRRLRLRQAQISGHPTVVLTRGEALLCRQPWDVATQVTMSRAADELGLSEVAVMILELARAANPREPRVNRPLAQLYERQGNFSRAVPLWQLVAEEVPTDPDASRKVKDLAASQTLTAGDYTGRALDEEGLVALRRDAAPTPQEQEQHAEKQRHRDIAKLKELIAAQPQKAEAYLRLAAILRSGGEGEAAREVLEQGLQATHRHFEVQMALVDLEIDPCRLNLHKVRERLEEQPSDPALRQQEAQWQKEVLARELAYYRQRADRTPGDGGARLQAAVRLRQLGKPKEAILELEPLKNLERWGWRALAELAECYAMRRNGLLARKHWEQALAVLPSEAVEERVQLQQRMIEGLGQLGVVTTPMPVR